MNVLVQYVGKNVLKVVGKMMEHFVGKQMHVKMIKIMMDHYVIQNVVMIIKVLDQYVGVLVIVIG